ncbi:MAG: hypothetical protein N0A15_16570, partial [Anaerolineae bacterium]|nr:hypothetical protein [Anaerolineae bacterium]
IINVVLITDRFVKAYKFKYPHMKIAMPSVLFNYLQLAFWSDDYRFDIKRIEVEFEEARVDYEKSLKPVSLDGFVLDCNNEFAGLSKNNVVRYSHPDAVYELNDIDASCVYDSVFKGYKKGGQEVLDFDYLYEYINQLNVKKVVVNTRVFWTSFNTLNSTDDENFNPNNAPIYNNPIVPYVNDSSRMPYIFPAISFKFRQYGRGGITGMWESVGQGSIYRLKEKLSKCYWVFYNSSGYARNNNGQWVNFDKHNSYGSLQSSNGLGWYYNENTQTLYIKLASNVNPDMENISVVVDNPTDWKA